MDYIDTLDMVRNMTDYQINLRLSSVSGQVRDFLASQANVVLCDRDLCGFLGIDYARFGKPDIKRAEVYVGVIRGIL